MGEKQTGFIGREENPSTIIVAMRPITLIAKKMRAQRVPAEKLQRMDSNVREKATLLSASLTLNDSIGVLSSKW
jgi:hypothetical protein